MYDVRQVLYLREYNNLNYGPFDNRSWRTSYIVHRTWLPTAGCRLLFMLPPLYFAAFPDLIQLLKLLQVCFAEFAICKSGEIRLSGVYPCGIPERSNAEYGLPHSSFNHSI